MMIRIILGLVVCALLTALTNDCFAQQKGDVVYAHGVKAPAAFEPIRRTAWQQSGKSEVEVLEELLPLIPGGIRALQAPQQLTAQIPQNLSSEDARENPAQGRAASPNFLPMPKPKGDGKVSLLGTEDNVSLSAAGADLSTILKLIADEHRLNLVLGPDVGGPITVSIADAGIEEVLDAILSVGGYVWHRNGNLLYVTRLAADSDLDPRVQGRSVRVFPLNYLAATEVERVVLGLLSAAGQAFTSESMQADQRRTQEILVVEDVPAGIERVAAYLAQVDQPPKQVLIEAHVLQVTLDDSLRHGINLEAVSKLAGAKIQFNTLGFADDSPASGATLGIDGKDLDSVVELIRTHNNARTLASPKVLVVNRQEAKIQIGSQLGYHVTTTTQTGTFQSVEFLDTGVVLSVTPIISDSGEILMTVAPEVSGGRINALGLPEEETTEVRSTILLPDGGGVVIGGLIKETEQDNHSMVPILGRIPKLGTLFRRHAQTGRRDEIIIALVTHIVPNVCDVRPHELRELYQTLPAHSLEALKSPGHQGVLVDH
ncbi:MAG: hypothetical protein R3C05_10990 [Pirellulaceae bacterium]